MRHLTRKICAAAISIAAFGTYALAEAPLAPPTEKATFVQEQACEDISLSVYFSTYEAMLSSYAMRTVNAASNQLAGCAVTNISATVVSEEAHSDETLAMLSEARATAVLDAFESRGIRARETQTDITDKANADLPNGTNLPLARRVDITLEAEPDYGL